MLKDLPESFTRPAWMDEVRAALPNEFPEHERLAQGIYLAHLNFHIDIENLIHAESPFMDDARAAWKAAEDSGMPVPADFWEQFVNDDGVCDDWTQITARWPRIEADPRPLLIYLTPVRKADQPPRGGWRWHKWGEYIGVHQPQHEYLFDEAGIEEVFVFSIVQLKEGADDPSDAG